MYQNVQKKPIQYQISEKKISSAGARTHEMRQKVSLCVIKFSECEKNVQLSLIDFKDHWAVGMQYRRKVRKCQILTISSTWLYANSQIKYKTFLSYLTMLDILIKTPLKEQVYLLYLENVGMHLHTLHPLVPPPLQCTPPRPSEMSEKNLSTLMKPFLTSHL